MTLKFVRNGRVISGKEASTIKRRLSELAEYIDRHYVEESLDCAFFEYASIERFPASIGGMGKGIKGFEADLEERLEHLDDTFAEYLAYLIKRKGMTNSEVYNGALVTRQYFSKIMKDPDASPSKFTALRLAVGARLNIDETKDLFLKAGYALSESSKTDIIFQFYIEKERQKEKHGWEFLFLGANIDAVQTAAGIGISRDRAAEYMCDGKGIEANFEALGGAISIAREHDARAMPSALGSTWKSAIEDDFKKRRRRK